MQNSLRAQRLAIETPLKILVKSPPQQTSKSDTQDLGQNVELRLLARVRWLEITHSSGTESGQLELQFVSAVSPAMIKCHCCGTSDSESHCYPYIDRFICETCCEKISEGGGF
jgi:hypothetical protein